MTASTPTKFVDNPVPVASQSTSFPELPCTCQACSEKRELELDESSSDLQKCWVRLRHAVRQMYRDKLPNKDGVTGKGRAFDIGKLKELVNKLCTRDPHQLYQRLESQGREYVMELKVALLQILVSPEKCGIVGEGGNAGEDGGNKTSSISREQARHFLKSMIREFVEFQKTAKNMCPFLEELEKRHLKRFGISWELVNHHLFESVVFQDSLVQSSLPPMLSYIGITLDNVTERLVGLSEIPEEMRDLATQVPQFVEAMQGANEIWMSAHDCLEKYTNQQMKFYKATLKAKQKLLKEDLEFFKNQRKLLESYVKGRKPKTGGGSNSDNLLFFEQAMPWYAPPESAKSKSASTLMAEGVIRLSSMPPRDPLSIGFINEKGGKLISAPSMPSLKGAGDDVGKSGSDAMLECQLLLKNGGRVVDDPSQLLPGENYSNIASSTSISDIADQEYRKGISATSTAVLSGGIGGDLTVDEESGMVTIKAVSSSPIGDPKGGSRSATPPPHEPGLYEMAECTECHKPYCSCDHCLIDHVINCEMNGGVGPMQDALEMIDLEDMDFPLSDIEGVLAPFSSSESDDDTDEDSESEVDELALAGQPARPESHQSATEGGTKSAIKLAKEDRQHLNAKLKKMCRQERIYKQLVTRELERDEYITNSIGDCGRSETSLQKHISNAYGEWNPQIDPVSRVLAISALGPNWISSDAATAELDYGAATALKMATSKSTAAGLVSCGRDSSLKDCKIVHKSAASNNNISNPTPDCKLQSKETLLKQDDTSTNPDASGDHSDAVGMGESRDGCQNQPKGRKSSPVVGTKVDDGGFDGFDVNEILDGVGGRAGVLVGEDSINSLLAALTTGLGEEFVEIRRTPANSFSSSSCISGTSGKLGGKIKTRRLSGGNSKIAKTAAAAALLCHRSGDRLTAVSLVKTTSLTEGDQGGKQVNGEKGDGCSPRKSQQLFKSDGNITQDPVDCLKANIASILSGRRGDGCESTGKVSSTNNHMPVSDKCLNAKKSPKKRENFSGNSNIISHSITKTSTCIKTQISIESHRSTTVISGSRERISDSDLAGFGSLESLEGDGILRGEDGGVDPSELGNGKQSSLNLSDAASMEKLVKALRVCGLADEVEEEMLKHLQNGATGLSAGELERLVAHIKEQQLRQHNMGQQVDAVGDEDEDSWSDRSSAASVKDGRHCDCCFCCELYGHATGSLPAISANYPQMRERLRQKLKKKQSEKRCDQFSSSPSAAPAPEAKKPEPGVRGDESLDALLNYINSSPGDAIPDRDKSAPAKTVKKKQKQKKENKKERKRHLVESESDGKTNEKKPAELDDMPKLEKAERKGFTQRLINEVKSTSYVKSGPTPGDKATIVANNSALTNGSRANGHVTSGDGQPAEGRMVETTIVWNGNCIQNGQLECQQEAAVVENIGARVETPREGECNQEIDSCGIMPVAKSRMKKSANDDLDEIFLPRDIDLETCDLDEADREVELFKRFVMNCEPRRKREKVNININSMLRNIRKPIVVSSAGGR